MVFPSFLRVVVTTRTESLEVNGTTVKRKYFGAKDLKFVDILAKALGFSYELLSTSDGEIGRPLPDGNWTGQMGMVQHNETDMVVGVISVTDQRLQVADFSYPYQRLRVTFATRKPEFSPHPAAFLWPFSVGVWLGSLFCLFTMPFVFSILLRKKHTIVKLALVTTSTFLHQDVDVTPKRVREYLLLLFWKLGVMFLIYGYTAVLLAFLTFPPRSGIRTIPQLAAGIAKGKYECFGLPGSFVFNILPKTPDPIVKLIGKNLIENAHKASKDIDGLLSKKKRPKKLVFVGPEDFVLPLKLKYFISEDEFFPALRAVALRKGFCCRSQLDRVIGYIWASGIYSKLVEESLFKQTLKVFRKSSGDPESSETPLSFEHVEGPLYILFVGYCLGTIALIFELIINKKCAIISQFVRYKILIYNREGNFIVKQQSTSKQIKVPRLKIGMKQHCRKRKIVKCHKNIIRII